jgi:hypothetical protein
MVSSNRMSRPIYGVSKRNNDPCNCVPETPPSVTLATFLGVLASLRTIIDRFYNAFSGVAQIVGTMTMSAKVPTPVFMRLYWIEEHKGIKFDKHNPTHLDDLKFIYNLYDKDWSDDPMFKAMGMMKLDYSYSMDMC